MGAQNLHPKEESKRSKIFAQNMNRIKNHNERFANGEVSYSLTYKNRFAHMSYGEIVRKCTGALPVENKSAKSVFKSNAFKVNDPGSSKPLRTIQTLSAKAALDRGDRPSHIPPNSEKDWSVTGFMAPVKDQGYCGACWAFSTVCKS